MGRNYYDKAFKENTVKLSYQRESVSSLSREIGVSSDLISKWWEEFLEYGSSSFHGRGVERLSDQEMSIRAFEKELCISKLELKNLKNKLLLVSGETLD